MKKKILKILIIVIYILFIASFVSNVFAINNEVSGMFTGTSLTDTDGTESIETILKIVLNTIQVAGAFIAVGILMVIACKYMLASAGDRADIKKYAITYIIGAVILFATSGIAAIIKNIMENAFNA